MNIKTYPQMSMTEVCSLMPEMSIYLIGTIQKNIHFNLTQITVDNIACFLKPLITSMDTWHRTVLMITMQEFQSGKRTVIILVKNQGI